ncbi:MAG TPA: AAA family ATPase, partial [Longimicrobiaceae bacterium]|nr:AAA family ATPase [Longimicrobiaceae bacterium]
ALLDNAEAKRGRMVLLAGDTGIGKTRLSRAVSDEAVRRGWSVAAGRAYPVEPGVPYAPF